jgi:hypothetical protein
VKNRFQNLPFKFQPAALHRVCTARVNWINWILHTHTLLDSTAFSSCVVQPLYPTLHEANVPEVRFFMSKHSMARVALTPGCQIGLYMDHTGGYMVHTGCHQLAGVRLQNKVVKCGEECQPNPTLPMPSFMRSPILAGSKLQKPDRSVTPGI